MRSDACIRCKLQISSFCTTYTVCKSKYSKIAVLYLLFLKYFTSHRCYEVVKFFLYATAI